MEFVVKKTNELTDAQKRSMHKLFEEVYGKERAFDAFERQYTKNCEGYSFHTFAEVDGEIVASNTMVPSRFYVGGTMRKFVNSIDTMVAKGHRGIENFYDMIKTSFNDAAERGYDAVYGAPNDNSYELFTKLGFMADVGKLDVFCLPYRVGGVKKKLAWLNPCSMLFSRLWLCTSSLFASKRVTHFHIEKDAESYNATRYERLDGRYVLAQAGTTTFSYKVMEHEGVRTAFIIDVFDKSPKNFCKAVAHLLKHERKNFDLILYVGHLPFGKTGLIKIPPKHAPKEFNFTAGVFNKEAIDKKELLDIDNWDVNLSSYDLI